MSQIPYYDSDHALLSYMSEAKCEEYLAAGTARAVRSKNGSLRRLYRLPRVRPYGTAGAAVAAMHGAASRTTERIRNDVGILISPPLIREHREVRKDGSNQSQHV